MILLFLSNGYLCLSKSNRIYIREVMFVHLYDNFEKNRLTNIGGIRINDAKSFESAKPCTETGKAPFNSP